MHPKVHPGRTARVLHHLFIPGIIALAAVGGCASREVPSGPEPPVQLSVLPFGEGQEGVTTFALAWPLRVLATQGGRSKAGVPVSWSIPEGDGSFTEPKPYGARTLETITGSDGTSSVTLVLGGQVGAYRVTARSGTAEVTFHATGTPGSSAVVRDFHDPEAVTASQAWKMAPGSVWVKLPGAVKWQFIYGVHQLVPSGDATQPSMDGPALEHEETFATPGQYPYRCRLHPGEWGVVSVLPQRPDRAGSAR